MCLNFGEGSVASQFGGCEQLTKLDKISSNRKIHLPQNLLHPKMLFVEVCVCVGGGMTSLTLFLESSLRP